MSQSKQQALNVASINSQIKLGRNGLVSSASS
nr:MAG TPA: hypothetical protein [Caudoviricetes sp.]